MITVRTLREEEPMPQHLGTGFEAMPVMKSFCWVAESDGQIIGMLMAAPCHGLLFIVRVSVDHGAPQMTSLLMWRKCMKEAKEMGFRGYFSYVNPKRESEASLMSLCTRMGGIHMTEPQFALGGSVERAIKF